MVNIMYEKESLFLHIDFIDHIITIVTLKKMKSKTKYIIAGGVSA